MFCSIQIKSMPFFYQLFRTKNTANIKSNNPLKYLTLYHFSYIKNIITMYKLHIIVYIKNVKKKKKITIWYLTEIISRESELYSVMPGYFKLQCTQIFFFNYILFFMCKTCVFAVYKYVYIHLIYGIVGYKNI